MFIALGIKKMFFARHHPVLIVGLSTHSLARFLDDSKILNIIVQWFSKHETCLLD
jgi:hypothetical protein